MWGDVRFTPSGNISDLGKKGGEEVVDMVSGGGRGGGCQSLNDISPSADNSVWAYIYGERDIFENIKVVLGRKKSETFHLNRTYLGETI